MSLYELMMVLNVNYIKDLENQMQLQFGICMTPLWYYGRRVYLLILSYIYKPGIYRSFLMMKL